MAIREQWPVQVPSGFISVSWDEEQETWNVHALVRDPIKKEERACRLCFSHHEIHFIAGGLSQWYNWLSGKLSDFSLEDWKLLAPHMEPAFQELKQYISDPPQEPVSIMVPEDYPRGEGDEEWDRWDMI